MREGRTMDITDYEDVIEVSEAATMLHVSEPTIRKYITEGVPWGKIINHKTKGSRGRFKCSRKAIYLAYPQLFPDALVNERETVNA